MIGSTVVIALVLRLYACRAPADLPRLETIGESIAAVSRTNADAAFLLTAGRFESGFCRDVHAGLRRGGLGEGLWQLEPGSHRERPFSGLDRASTEHAAEQALWLWHHAGCATLRQRFGLYAGLGCRSWPGAARRERLYWWVLRQLQRRAPRHGREVRV